MVLKANSITSTNTTTIPQTQIAEIKQEPSSATATSTSILPRSAGAKSDSTSSIATSSTTSSLSSSSVASHHTSSSGGGGGGHGQYPSSSMPATSAANHEVVHQQYPVGYPASFGLLPYQVVVIKYVGERGDWKFTLNLTLFS